MATLDMSLDDIIKSKSRGGRGGRGIGRGAARGRGGGQRGGGAMRDTQARRTAVRSSAAAPYARPMRRVEPRADVDEMWVHDMYQEGPRAHGVAGGIRNIETGTRVMVTNLHDGVTEDDIKDLFEEVGDIKRYQIFYDAAGRSIGKAEVVFSRKADAMQAVAQYNGVALDGVPLTVRIVGSNLAAAPAAGVRRPILDRLSAGAPRRMNPSRITRGGRGAAVSSARGGASAARGTRGRGRGRGGRGGGRGRGGRGGRANITAEDLDKDLEAYNASAQMTDA
eukprot:tig00000194_g14767.t1